MTEIQKFAFGIHEIRTVLIDGEPWWVLKDVSDVLGYRQSQDAKKNLAPDQVKHATRMFNAKGRPPLLVSEGGLYQLILRSNKPEAKVFQRWVTDEVLPTIRKTGGVYIQPGSQAELDLTDPDTALDKLIEVAQVAKAERAKRLKAEALAAEQAARIEADTPKVRYAEQVRHSTNSLSVEELAKELNSRGYETGKIRLFADLRKRGILFRSANGHTPYQRYVHHFDVASVPVTVSGGAFEAKTVTRLKASSLPWFLREFGVYDPEADRPFS